MAKASHLRQPIVSAVTNTAPTEIEENSIHMDCPFDSAFVSIALEGLGELSVALFDQMTERHPILKQSVPILVTDFPLTNVPVYSALSQKLRVPDRARSAVQTA
ncbi:hypothetical protein NBRC116597_34510 [Phaeobacter sp. NW0010-22]